MAETERKCTKCGRKLYEGEGKEDGICGDCGLEMMFTGMGAVYIKKEAGEPFTAEMIEQAEAAIAQPSNTSVQPIKSTGSR